MKKIKTYVASTPEELAKIIGLSPAEGAEMVLRVELNLKIKEIVKKKRLTHAQVAKLAGTSRTRVTALLNNRSLDISTDLMLRILSSLGYAAKITFHKAA